MHSLSYSDKNLVSGSCCTFPCALVLVFAERSGNALNAHTASFVSSFPNRPRQATSNTQPPSLQQGPFSPKSAMTMMMSTMSIDVNAAMMDSIPRLRWSPANNRFHYNMPVAAEPGARGFVLLQEFEHAGR